MSNKIAPQSTAETDSPRGVPAAPEAIADAIHTLRNSMNTLLMNAAVLGSGGSHVPESLRPFAERIAKAGSKCSEDLARLFELIDTRGR